MVSETDSVEQYEVVVVGAGPVGLSTALFLADRGVRVLVLDKRDPLSSPPRAGTSVRTLELFRTVGLGADLEEACWDGPAPLQSVIKDSAIGAVRHRAAPPEQYAERLASCSPIGIRRTMTQDALQRLALEQLRLRGGHVRFGVQFEDADAGADVVRSRLSEAGTGRERRVVSRYLIGADGAHSRVRSLSGIGMPDREVAARLHTAFFRADLRGLLPESATHSCFIRNEHIYCTLFAKTAAGDRWSSHIMDYPGKPTELEPLAPEQTLRFLHAAIGDGTVPIDLIECNPWEAALGIASSFRRGRIFLAGDAAHVQSSAGGLGMNTGIQDGHNLAWKLAAVLHGGAGEALLDTYEPERRAAAEASLALSYGMHRGYQTQQDTNELYARLADDYLRGMLLYRYESGAVLGGDDPLPGVLDDHAVPGCRLPHRWLDDGDRRRSTLDLVGPDWTLLVGPSGSGWFASGVESDELRVRLCRPATAGDDAAAFAELAGTEPDGALLVRPDGFVAWRSARRPADPGGTVRSVLRALRGHI
ncbi:FAD-dependent oxidoreductase [Streptomyces nanshensis]|uniref:FAD-binding monooxygenase n=1 Tax=Streptomyces nanshensis TaxID=518642 RepID=A0A1E7L9Q3_9ACTN|nr:FAD-dependent oxidoreductase [Streptomyces nanshensis]OEV12831.1 FAD-binding monooxygenase [Streptomyces nanshensis]